MDETDDFDLQELFAAERRAAAFRIDPMDPVHNTVWSDVTSDGDIKVLADKPVEVLSVEQVGCLSLTCNPKPPVTLQPGDIMRMTVELPVRKRGDAARTIIRYRFVGSDEVAVSEFRARRVG
ncbi:hypothetical protein [Bifidobacterium callitrichidarum]|uniref:Uncharacterized protein n=1 Tax=Bifidobacterium callitrichidarum TaxID=2052941 RepID=A0A2U2N0Q2_9BIFI|nr:hypothetical protein [Bifidobacterium callitrichidarum]PWG62648.1 hypothetical protein DF196_11865 [Bifidobacterium callitrichidarum]